MICNTCTKTSFLYKRLIFLVFSLFFNVFFAQELPPINIFTPQQYGAENQNWDISQASNNLIYVANNAGLLEFNGAEWKLYPVPDKSVVRSVKAIGDKIFTGSFMDFGYWQKNDQGVLNYNSLKNILKLEFIDGEEFWNIEHVDGWIVFQSLSRIYMLDIENEKINIIEAKTPISKMIYVDEGLYFQELQRGLFKIEHGKEILISNDTFFKDHKIITILKKGNKLLYLTENKGFYEFVDNKQIEWETLLNKNNYSVYNAIILEDNSIVLGTISNGVFFLNASGDIKYRLNREKGISNNTILNLFEDSYNNIWLGLDNGINCVNAASKFKVYTDQEGKLGTVYTSLAHNEYLYIGTNQGLFFKKRKADGDFKFIEGTKGQVWMLKDIYGYLFCGHDKGTIVIKNNAVAQIIDDAIGTWDFKVIPNKTNLLLQGNYKGLNILEKQNDQWVFKNKIEGHEISSRFFELVGNKIYVNHEFEGFYKLEIDTSFKKVLHRKRIDFPKKGHGSNILRYNKALIYSSSIGVYKQNRSSEFIKDTSFTMLFDSSKRLTTLMEIKEEQNKLWRYSGDNISIVVSSSMSSKPKLINIPISKDIRNMVAGFENITKIDANEYLIGTSNGYLLFNNYKKQENKKLNINIDAVEVYRIDESKERVSLNNEVVLKNKQNNIQFHYSFPFFNQIVKNKYQYQLLGLSEKWSDWTQNSTQLFENLPYGKYTFKVRGNSGNNNTNIISYRFEIERPIHLSNLAFFIYFILSVLLFRIIHMYYKRYYKRQQQKLLEKTQNELSRKELENQQQLMRFNNEKLKQDIENKNRELGISTMSLIKKNEFLNSLKKELQKKNDSNNLRDVIKIIDKNINNADDWHLFEEAFNNADKDFLKKIKNIHPSLTPNDLRLCTYLRLNLSSKEIAPLLNISPRSVEVKRYRLRKKMQLAHEASLTDYILKI